MKNKKSKKSTKIEKFLGRVHLYFQTGHSLILILPWIISQTTIWFYLLIENIPELSMIVPNYFMFLIIFSLCYGLFTIFFGYWYVRRSELFPSEQLIRTKMNPYNRDLARAIILLSDGKKEDVKALLSKWIER